MTVILKHRDPIGSKLLLSEIRSRLLSVLKTTTYIKVKNIFKFHWVLTKNNTIIIIISICHAYSASILRSTQSIEIFLQRDHSKSSYTQQKGGGGLSTDEDTEGLSTSLAFGNISKSILKFSKP